MSLSVGVVVPNFRGGRFLRECLDSLLTQDYPNLQIIVMDGGSDDDSVEILRSYADRISWVSEPDEGQSDAINKGLALLDTDIVGWLNSDDALLPGAVRRVVEAAQSDPAAVLFHGDLDVVDIDGNWLATSESIDLTYDLMRSGRGRTLQPGSFYRTSAVRKIGGVNREFYLLMDVDLWIRLLRTGSSRRVPAKLARFRVHPEAKSSEKPYRYYKETVMLGARHERDRLLRASLRRSAQVALHYARRGLGLSHAQQRRVLVAQQAVGDILGNTLARGKAALASLRGAPARRGAPPPCTAEVFPGGKFVRHPDSVSVEALLSASDLDVMSFMRAYLRAGDTVLDVGAGEGVHSVLAATLVGDRGHVVAFEADPGAADRLLENVRCSGLKSVELRRTLPREAEEGGRQAVSERLIAVDGAPTLARLAIGHMGSDELQRALARWGRGSLPVWLLEAASRDELDPAIAALSERGYVLARYQRDSKRLAREPERGSPSSLFAVHESRWEWVTERLAERG